MSCKSYGDSPQSVPVKDPIPSFIKKTYDLLEDDKIQDIVSWNDDGTCIVIKDANEFAKKVLPQYFKHSKLTSFVRQVQLFIILNFELNMYNFHKKKTLNSYQVYYHELFQRGKKNMLNKIRRKANENSLERSVHELEVLNSARNEANFAQENILLKRLNRDALSKMYSLEAKLKELCDQNKYLWDEIYKKEKRQEYLQNILMNGSNEEIHQLQPVSSTMEKKLDPRSQISTEIYNQSGRIPYWMTFRRDSDVPLQFLIPETNTSVVFKDPNQNTPPEIPKLFDPISPDEDTYFDHESFPELESGNIDRDNQDIFVSENQSSKENTQDSVAMISLAPTPLPHNMRPNDAESEDNY